jgi:hypothetical protein
MSIVLYIFLFLCHIFFSVGLGFQQVDIITEARGARKILAILALVWLSTLMLMNIKWMLGVEIK